MPNGTSAYCTTKPNHYPSFMIKLLMLKMTNIVVHVKSQLIVPTPRIGLPAKSWLVYFQASFLLRHLEKQ